MSAPGVPFDKDALLRSFARVKLAYWTEVRQPLFAEFMWVFDHVWPKKEWWCRRCIRERRCLKGVAQGFQCLAYWHTEYVLTPSQHVVINEVPLQDTWLQYLTHAQLLSLFYARCYSLMTVTDFSKVGLRTRLLQSVQDTSASRLTDGS